MAFHDRTDVGSRKITPGKTEVIDGIKQVGFTDPIGAATTNNPLVKGKLTGMIVPELG